MADPRHVRGRAAERAVARWLTDHGWQILAERHRSAQGEIDLVALDPGACLVGVEVRLRASPRAGDARESVRAGHIRRVRAALSSYAREQAISHEAVRVDLVAVSPGAEPGTWRLSRLPGVDGW